MTINYTGLSQAAIDLLNDKEPNRTYMVTWDNDGDITELKVMGSAKPKTPKKFISALNGAFEHILDTCVAYTREGSMVIAFQREYDAETTVVPSHPLGEGFVVYEKKPLRIFNTLEDAAMVLLEKEESTRGTEFACVLRFKRRQNKWFLHTGWWFAELDPEFDTSKEAKTKAYDLASRRHLYEAKSE